MSGIGAMLKRKVFGIPVWVLVAVGAFLLYWFYLRGAFGAGAAQDATGGADAVDTASDGGPFAGFGPLPGMGYGTGSTLAGTPIEKFPWWAGLTSHQRSAIKKQAIKTGKAKK